ncbi:MAG: hypothetical protein RL111_434 [Pseudomonadota bacterium]
MNFPGLLMRLLSGSLMIVLLMSGCTIGYQHTPAPVEDRTKSSPTMATPGRPQELSPGQYVVRPGDTLIRIGLEQGQNWRDIARWNNIDKPDRIEVGQVLRVQPTAAESNAADSNGVVVTPVSRTSVIEPAGNLNKADPVQQGSNPASKPDAVQQAEKPVNNAVTQPSASIELTFTMPTKGKVIGTFDGLKNKGIDIAGKLGDPVVAAADGRVVYSGAGLRGYGNLVIIKHNNTYLTAYAHNDKLLVKEDQFIKQGQKIAEMGSTEADQVKLHFEIRKMGKPVDPMPLITNP